MVRLASAAVLAAVVLVTVWWLPPVATVALAAVAAAVAAVELAGLFVRSGVPVPAPIVAGSSAVACVGFAATAYGLGAGQSDTLALTMLVVLVAAGLVALAAGPPTPSTLATAAALCAAPVYIGLPLGAVAWIQAARGPRVLTALIVIVVASDSAQYAAGRLMGRRKLAPLVSPGKTVEGAIGGGVAAAVAGAALGGRAIPGVGPAGGAALGVGVAVFGLAGDLFESLLKRSAGVKDSSSIVPGHGGLLDRLDSWLFAAPVFYVFLRYFA